LERLLVIEEEKRDDELSRFVENEDGKYDDII